MEAPQIPLFTLSLHCLPSLHLFSLWVFFCSSRSETSFFKILVSFEACVTSFLSKKLLCCCRCKILVCNYMQPFPSGSHPSETFPLPPSLPFCLSLCLPLAFPLLSFQSPRAYGDNNDAAAVQSCRQGKELKSSAEDTGQHKSPSLKKSPKEGRKVDGAVVSTVEEEEEPAKDRMQQNRPQSQQPSTGPASRAAHGSSTSIPFIDCSDVDSEYDLLRGQITRSYSQTNDNYEGDLTSGAYIHYRDENRNRTRYRDSSASLKSSQYLSEEYLDDNTANLSFYPGGSPRMPRHSSLVDEMFRGPGSRSPLATPLPPSSKESSPNMSLSRTGSQGYVSENGHDCRARPGEEDSRATNCHGYCRYSPGSPRPRAQKTHNPCNKSVTDPFILSQISSTPGQEYRSERYFKGGGVAKMSSPEGKLMANGMPAGAQSKQSPVMQSLRAGGMVDHMAAIQMMEGSTSSGTESSDSDSEVINPFTHPLVFGNPVVLSSSPMPRNKYSFGSLQLDEEVEEDVSVGLSDEDGVQVFSC